MESQKNTAEEAGVIADEVFGTKEAGKKEYAVECSLVETYAPQKVEMSQSSYDVTLRFNTDEDTVNEQYFYYEDSDGTPHNTRIINYLRDQYPVTVHKFGYRATDEILAQKPTDHILKDIEDLPGKKPLSGVLFVLEKYNYVTGKYEAYGFDTAEKQQGANAAKGEFKSRGDGTFKFDKGLPLGDYRIYEKNLGDNKGYYNMYPGQKNDGSGACKYFTVGTDGADVYIFNPELLKLEVEKTLLPGADETGVSLNGIKFQLKGNNRTIDKELTGQTDKVLFGSQDPLQPGTYTLTETLGNNSVTNAYFNNYYPAASRKIYLGYVRKWDGNTKTHRLEKLTGKDGVVPELKSSEDGTYTIASLAYANPRTGGLEIAKVDAEDNTLLLEGATFSYAFAKFRNEDFVKNGGKTQLKSLEELTDETNMAGLGKLTYETKKDKLTTGADGKAKVNGLIPGWYKIWESAAPKGYAADGTPKYVAVTGDMASKDGAYHYAEYTGVTFEDRKTVQLNLEKILDYGNLNLQLIQESDRAPESVTFEIFKGTAPENAVTTGISHTFSKADFTADQGIINAWKELTNKLPQLALEYEHYYLKEEVRIKEGQNWYYLYGDAAPKGSQQENSLTQGYGGMIQIDSLKSEGGRFRVKEDVSVSLTNRIGMAQITVKKVDKNDHSKPLSGAEFAVYDGAPGADGRPTGTIVASGTTDETGTCVMNVWLGDLDENGEDAFWILETKAPSHYVLNEKAVSVKVKPGEVASYDKAADHVRVYEDLLFENEAGIDINLTKYRDTYENLFGEDASESNPENQVQEKDAFFDLYTADLDDYEAGRPVWVKVKAGSGIEIAPENGEVSGTGRLSWTGLPVEGKVYALYEHEITSGDYKNYMLNSVHRMDGNGPSEEKLTLLENAETKESADSTDSASRNIYLLGDGSVLESGAAYGFAAFNKPAARVRILKEAAENDPTANAPRAAFRIVDISDPENETIVEDRIETQPITYETDLPDIRRYTMAVVPLKEGRYRIEEIESLTDGFAIVKNDSRVVWKQEITIPSKEGGNSYVFANLKTDESLAIDKKATNGPLENLWWTDEQTASYDIALKISNKLPLTSFTFTDKGLSMMDGNGTELESSYSYETFSLKELAIPVPTADNRFVADEDGTPYQTEEESAAPRLRPQLYFTDLISRR